MTEMRPSELDTRRAALCCLAINQDCPESVHRLFERYRDLNFSKVVIPPFTRKWKKNDPQKLLFATAVDVSNTYVVYVTFKGSPALADIVHGSYEGHLSILNENLEHRSSKKADGYFHELFYEQLVSLVPQVDRIFQYVERLTMEGSSGSSHGKSTSWIPSLKVVFCGHGSGGAISHMAMLTYLLSLSTMSSRDTKLSSMIMDTPDNTDNLISLSFGAPLFCDESTINGFDSKTGTSLGKYFFNYFAKLDPVPFMLFGLPSQEGEEKQYMKVRDKFSKVLNEVGSLLDSPEASNMDNNSYVQRSLTNTSLKQLAYLHDELSRIRGLHPYGLFGRYIDVGGAVVSDSFNSMTTPQKELEELAVQRKASFGQVPYLEAHAMMSYFRALSRGEERDQPHSSVSVASIMAGDPPEVTNASMVIIRGQERRLNRARIEVTGRNLSPLLESKCCISTLHKNRWSVIAGDDRAICWETTSALTDGELKELENSGTDRPATKIKVETAFGRMKDFAEVHLRSTTAGSFAVDGLKHALGKLVILADTKADTKGLPGLRLSERKIRKRVELAGRMAGIPGSLVEDVERVLRNQKHSVRRKKEILDEGIFKKICEELCERSLVLEFEQGDGSLVAETVNYMMGIFQMVLSVINPIAGLVAIPVILGVKGIVLLVQYMLRRNHVELRTYEEIIKFLYAQIMSQRTEGEAGSGSRRRSSGEAAGEEDQENNQSLASTLSIRSCEQAIYWSVEKEKYASITFSPKLKYRTEVNQKMKVRTHLVHAVQKAYYKAKVKKVLAVVGMENAGKSTLINVLSRHYRSSSFEEELSDADTGFCSHTSEVQGFYIGGNYIAVDFPGVGGTDATRSNTWESFEKVPDLCIVMVKFSGDADNTCQNLRSIFAEKLCKRYILLVNQVDCIMKGKVGSKVWKEYSPEAVKLLRQNYMLGPFSRKDTVYMCCLNDEDLYEFEREQLKARGILFGNDVARKVFALLDVENTEETF